VRPTSQQDNPEVTLAGKEARNFWRKNKNAGLVGQARSLSFICGELDWFSRLSPRISKNKPQITAFGLNSQAERIYITSARFSSSCWRIGKAQPAISTRLTASLAACGETP